jgi:hypothetical protein
MHISATAALKWRHCFISKLQLLILSYVIVLEEDRKMTSEHVWRHVTGNLSIIYKGLGSDNETYEFVDGITDNTAPVIIALSVFGVISNSFTAFTILNSPVMRKKVGEIFIVFH